MPSDTELYRRWVSGDREAGDQLVDRHCTDIYRWIKRRVGEDAAQDISQATWLEAQRSASYRGDGQFRGWLLTIARRQIARARRRREADPPDDGRAGTSPSRAVLRLEAAEAVAALPERVGEPARRYWRGEPADSIAADLGVPLKTVRSRIRIAAERLRRQLA